MNRHPATDEVMQRHLGPTQRGAGTVGLHTIFRAGRTEGQGLRQNPLLASGADVATLHVGFLATAPGKKSIDALDANRSPPDTFVVLGREIYLACPNGMGKTKLTNAYFDAKLATTSTMRNWKTVLTLREMTLATPAR